MPNASELMRNANPTEAALVIDTHMRICSANEAAHQLLGYRADSLKDMSLAWLLPPARQGLLSELRAAQRNGGRVCVPGALMREDGSLVGVILTTQACTHGGGSALAVELVPDDDPTLARTRNSQTFPLPRGARSSASPSRKTATPPPVPAEALSPKRPPSAPPKHESARAAATAVAGQLSTCLDLLHWLDAQVLGQASQDSPKQRALARVVLHQAAELLEECRGTLHAHTD